MYKELLKKVTNLGSPKVLLVGDYMLDSYVYGDALRISPEAPVPVLRVVRKESKCGGAASVVADLAALGASPICIGVLGKDYQGQRIKDLLSEVGADLDGLVELDNRPTTNKERLIGLAQHRHQQQLMRVDDEIAEPLSQSEAEKLIAAYEQKLPEADIVCLQDYDKGVLTEQVCQKCIELAKKAGKRVLVDPPLKNDYSKFRGASAMTPNRKEASEAVGFTINNQNDAERASQALMNQLELEAAVITMDKDGAYLHSDTVAEMIPTIARTVYDVTGAGDVVLAAMATSLAGGCDYVDAVRIANIAGGLEVEKFGVATVSIDEIVNEIISRHKSKTGKILDDASLVKVLDYHRKDGDTIVFTNGCFDVLHRGHTEYLRFAKEQGGVLVLGLNTDASVRANKGPERPINNQHDRAAVLAALECVDYIVFFDEETPAQIIPKVCPDILIKGKDWADKGVVGSDFVEARGGKVVLADLVDGKSSTNTINKMKELGDK